MSNKIDKIVLEPRFSEREMKLRDNFGQMYQREIENAGRVISKLEDKIWCWRMIEDYNRILLMKHIGDDMDEHMQGYLSTLEDNLEFFREKIKETI